LFSCIVESRVIEWNLCSSQFDAHHHLAISLSRLIGCGRWTDIARREAHHLGRGVTLIASLGPDKAGAITRHGPSRPD